MNPEVEAKHTPTPWFFEGTYEGAAGFVIGNRKTKTAIADFQYSEDARIAVLAVNQHAALKKQNADLIDIVVSAKALLTVENESWPNYIRSAFAELRKAIKAMEAKS